jgi:hypothetical protein
MSTIRKTFFVVVLVSLAFASSSRATSLTFDIYTDAAKTVTPADNAVLATGNINLYGDNVTDFSPTAPFGSVPYYFNYGSASNRTDDVAVEYRWAHATTISDNAPTAVKFYTTGFGDLTNVIFNAQPSPYLLEIRLVPSSTSPVRLESFDLAGFGADKIVPTIEVVQDYNTPSATTLWGPFANTVISGTTHTTFTPNVAAGDGHTLSLLFGADGAGVFGLDNVIFSVPEPSAMALLAIGWLALWRRSVRNGS